MKTGFKEILMVLIPLVIAAGAVYGVALGGEYLVMPAEKRISHLPSSADNALRAYSDQAFRLSSAALPGKTERFTLRPLDDEGLLAQFDNSEIYEKLAAQESAASAEGAAEKKEDPDAPPKYRISSILRGEDRTFAVINGKIYHRGDKISADEHIARIETRRILLKGKWGDRWIAVNF
ncbi:hypothetical protein EP073_00025 [Geovibrio thiophilus]|uniref:Uncharacterized protein n=1 Tax=Geovibrio thiophilus TaxID=139438 RepID=A0A3R5UZ42_9BACT|nr:hypothetical protein [Geovibrio thiophilus]QAR31845.1 hypothetical protein EP073_00025 [Geovibrio thiophilus]